MIGPAVPRRTVKPSLPRAFPTAPRVTCASCAAPDVVVGQHSMQAMAHWRPGFGPSMHPIGPMDEPPPGLCQDVFGRADATVYRREVEAWRAGVGAA